MSEGDESETKAAPPAAPRRKKRKRKKARPDAIRSGIEVVMDPSEAPIQLVRGIADAVPQTPFFAPQRFVVAGGLATIIGLGLVGTGPSDVGRALWIGGVLVLVVGIHLLGRLGPDTGAG